MKKNKVLLFWSGGKDSNLALTRLKNSKDFEVVALLTTINSKTNTVKYHGIPETLLIDQAKLLSLPLIRVYHDENISNEDYILSLSNKISSLKKLDLSGIAFGDIHLNDVKQFKENFCHKLNLEAVFPLWGESESSLLEEYFSTNHQAIITSIDRSKLDNSFLAKLYNQEWLDRLPSGIDPMGENGEFHTFATFSPYFKMRVPFSKTIAIEEGPYTVSLLKEP
jgi:uncharacterized protein (TIGR00290 family)